MIFLGSSVYAQNKQTYKVNGTTYVNGETYKTTGNPKVERSSSAKTEFLKSKGLKKVPSGYQVDHIVMGKVKKRQRHSGQTREPPKKYFDSS